MVMEFSCDFCGEPVDPTETGVYKRIVGWVQIRKKGGSNAVSLPSEPMGWMHKHCMTVAQYKHKKGLQDTALF